MTTIVQSTVRAIFNHPEIQQYMLNHDPAAMGRALAILQSPDDAIAPLDVIRLAETLGTVGAGGSLNPIAHPGIAARVTTELAKSNIPNLGELFAMARAHSESARAEEEDRLRPTGDQDPTRTLAHRARMERNLESPGTPQVDQMLAAEFGKRRYER